MNPLDRGASETSVGLPLDALKTLVGGYLQHQHALRLNILYDTAVTGMCRFAAFLDELKSCTVFNKQLCVCFLSSSGVYLPPPP